MGIWNLFLCPTFWLFKWTSKIKCEQIQCVCTYCKNGRHTLRKNLSFNSGLWMIHLCKRSLKLKPKKIALYFIHFIEHVIHGMKIPGRKRLNNFKSLSKTSTTNECLHLYTSAFNNLTNSLEYCIFLSNVLSIIQYSRGFIIRLFHRKIVAIITKSTKLKV